MRCLITVACFLAASAGAQSVPPADHDLASLQFLVGDWVADPRPGGDSGHFEFRFELQDRILVRRNHAEIIATKDRPAGTHDDLMVVFRESPQAVIRADYFDSEGHVIRYLVEVVAEKRATFVSEESAGAPRFRLSYVALPDSGLRGKFEVAPPEKSAGFAPYLDWTARRVKTQRPGAELNPGQPDRP